MSEELDRLRAENELLRDALRLAKEAAAEAIDAGVRMQGVIADLMEPEIRLGSGECAIIFRDGGIKVIVPTAGVAGESFMIALGVVHACSDSVVGGEIRGAISRIMAAACADDGVMN